MYFLCTMSIVLDVIYTANRDTNTVFAPQCIVVHSKTVIIITYSVYIYQNYKWMLYYWDLDSHYL